MRNEQPTGRPRSSQFDVGRRATVTAGRPAVKARGHWARVGRKLAAGDRPSPNLSLSRCRWADRLIGAQSGQILNKWPRAGSSCVLLSEPDLIESYPIGSDPIGWRTASVRCFMAPRRPLIGSDQVHTGTQVARVGELGSALEGRAHAICGTCSLESRERIDIGAGSSSS